MPQLPLSRDQLQEEIRCLLEKLGEGRVDGVAYDTAWVARLSTRYPGQGFENALQWLRRNQYEDGTWGGPLVHYHDRFISTLAAIIALREVGNHPRDERRVKRGEDALWKIVGRLGQDDSDTVGFPALSAALAEEAAALELDVPQPPVRYAEAYKHKLEAFLNQTRRNWRDSPFTVSFEALRSLRQDHEYLLSANNSVATSPSATAAYLLDKHDDHALSYLQTFHDHGEGVFPAFSPIDLFEVGWVLHHLRSVNAIMPDQPEIKPWLERLSEAWSTEKGVSHSVFYGAADLDDTAMCYSLLRWGGYDIDSQVFAHYETPHYFSCYVGETNPSVSVQVRLLNTLREFAGQNGSAPWIDKLKSALYLLDENGSFWWDKWHASPYYVTGLSIDALYDFDPRLAKSRQKWILRTQNDDGGWGYWGQSTAEETAYCLRALLTWDRHVERVDRQVLREATDYLVEHIHDEYYPPLWIAKSLYTPPHVVRAAILASLWDAISDG